MEEIERVLRRVKEKYIIDKSKEEFKDVPATLEGELLLERVYGPDGRLRGWITVSWENFINLFKDAILKHIKTGKPLFDCLLEVDEVYEEVDLDNPDIEALCNKYGLTKEYILSRIQEAKRMGLRGRQRICILKRGYRKYFEKWRREGLI